MTATAEIYDFTTGLRPRSIEQIPVIHQPRGPELYCIINDREMEIFPAGGFWHWRTVDYPWHHPLFEDSKPQRFESAAEAQQDAMGKLGDAA